MFASDEDVEADCEAYDCEACPVADALADLHDDAENERAWRLFHRAITRFSMDTGAVVVLLERLTKDLDAEEFSELMARFAIFYEAVCPPQRPGEEG
jgi:uncharacterized protein (UPF0276 family)